jgi:hypothetical protein
MSFFLVASILLAIISVIYVWYVTRYTNSIPDDKPVPLDNDDDKILVNWYKMNMKQSYDFNINDANIAAKYLHRIYNIDVNPSLLIIGTDLDDQYHSITGTRILPKSSNNIQTDKDCIFDLRSTSGKNGMIAMIHDHKIRTILKRNNNSFDLTELNLIIESELDIIARDYLEEILKLRWEQIQQLDDSNVLNNEGSYLFLRVSDYGINGTPITVLGNITAMMTPKGARINLLCSNYEFEALINRWKQYLSSKLAQ